MWQVGDPVHHKVFGNGVVAKTSGAHAFVIFDNANSNQFVPTDPPPTEEYVDKISGRVRTKTAGPAPLDGKTIYWDKPASEMPQPKVEKKHLTKEQEPWKYPNTPKYCDVIRVDQTIMGEWNEQEQRLVLFPKEGFIDLRLLDNETGEKYKVQVSSSKDPVLAVGRKIVSDQLTGLLSEGDEIW